MRRLLKFYYLPNKSTVLNRWTDRKTKRLPWPFETRDSSQALSFTPYRLQKNQNLWRHRSVTFFPAISRSMHVTRRRRGT
ncbi:hypothetical protein MGG_17136, partial [Pyricularia oryzae 70-15]